MKFSRCVLLFIAMAGLLFGQAKPAAPAPAMAVSSNGPILPSHKIRANDLIGVAVLDEPELTRTIRVDPEGMIRLPLLKDKIKADGLMPEQLEKTIAAALKSEEILVDPDVTVTVAEYSLSRPITVAGAVRSPTTFQVVGTISLLEAITRAGGVSQDAGGEILITRARPQDSAGAETDGAAKSESNGLVERVRVKSLISGTDPSSNLTLTGGEEIRVPEGGHIYVFGNVKKPGTLPLEDPSDASVFKAVALTDGLAPYAAKQAYIFRLEAGGKGRTEIPVDLKRIVDHKIPDVPLMANDILYVPDNTARRNTMTSLKVVGGLAAVAVSALIYIMIEH